ncbi:HAD-IA family hydrolase, partial [Arthrospira platensis SPKY1]|nr:HAD-IA family hydrolase [Arthrospira platensis SPKY1]
MPKEVLRSQRFLETLNDFGAADAPLAEKMSAYYLYHAPRTVFLFPNTMKVLAYLHEKYPLYIITNGFEEVQHIKMKTSGMDQYFSCIITSEAAGVKKPAAEIFHYAMKQSNAEPSFSLMIGDDPEVDVQGAINTGMDAILFDPHQIHQNT